MKLSEAIAQVKGAQGDVFSDGDERDAKTLEAIGILLGVAEYALGSGDVDYAKRGKVRIADEFRVRKAAL